MENFCTAAQTLAHQQDANFVQLGIKPPTQAFYRQLFYQLICSQSKLGSHPAPQSFTGHAVKTVDERLLSCEQ